MPAPADCSREGIRTWNQPAGFRPEALAARLDLSPMEFDLIEEARKTLWSRQERGGGFSVRPGSPARVDSTVWAALGLRAGGISPLDLDPALRFLIAAQREDGSIPVLPAAPDAIWPTSLCVLAWAGLPAASSARRKAVDLLLRVTGTHPEWDPDGPTGHDTSIPGWPWVSGTHSWVEPTAFAVLALSAAGQAGHERVREGRRLLENRQLEGGGWNYGSTSVYGRELRPLPEATGIALSALAGHVSPDHVEASLDYLAAEVAVIRTPLSLGWGLIGLSAWHVPVPGARGWLAAALDRQTAAGEFDTAGLATLLLATDAIGSGRIPFPTGGPDAG